ncbi:MAG: hypothetical protein HAW67_03050 [Endozoicomonadaceae bacterium]|nr:hypothetical protein [Endozoicomonadaceae bacterium]
MKHPNHFLANFNQSRLKQTQIYIIYLLLSAFAIVQLTNNLHQLELDETETLQVVEGGIGGSGLTLLPLSSLNA